MVITIKVRIPDRVIEDIKIATTRIESGDEDNLFLSKEILEKWLYGESDIAEDIFEKINLY